MIGRMTSSALLSALYFFSAIGLLVVALQVVEGVVDGFFPGVQLLKEFFMLPIGAPMFHELFPGITMPICIFRFGKVTFIVPPMILDLAVALVEVVYLCSECGSSDVQMAVDSDATMEDPLQVMGTRIKDLCDEIVGAIEGVEDAVEKVDTLNAVITNFQAVCDEIVGAIEGVEDAVEKVDTLEAEIKNFKKRMEQAKLKARQMKDITSGHKERKEIALQEICEEMREAALAFVNELDSALEGCLPEKAKAKAITELKKRIEPKKKVKKPPPPPVVRGGSNNPKGTIGAQSVDVEMQSAE
jgi:hypothetical protein